MPLVGFEPTISADEWLQTYALHCAATGTGVTIIDRGYYENFECAAWNTKDRLRGTSTAVLPIHKSEKAEDHRRSACRNKILVYTA
jgi:hypothetical protein